MTTIVTRAGKGSPLTHTEVDTNFTNLNTNKLETAAIPLGTAAAPSVSFVSDPNSGVFSPGADQVAISTNGVQRLSIDASGNVAVDTNTLYVDAVNNRVAVGTTSPAAKLSVSLGGVAGTIAQLTDGFQQSLNIASDAGSGSAGVVSYDTANGAAQAFKIGTTERARIDSSGRLLVGTSSLLSDNWSGNNESIQTAKSGLNTLTILAATAFTPAHSSYFALNRARGTLAVPTIVSSGDTLGGIYFSGYDGSAYLRSASIDCVVDADPGANDMPTRLVFSTTPDGAASPTSSPPAMTIKSSQEVLIGTSTITANGGILQLKSGITFPATPVAATDVNTLDDYEEGTFTPILADAATGGNVAASYTAREGIYTKIGRSVSVICKIVFPVTTGMTAGNEIFVRGIPFSAAQQSFGSVYLRGITFPASTTFVQSFLHMEASNTVQFVAMGSAVSEVYLTVASIASGSAIFQFAFSYNV